MRFLANFFIVFPLCSLPFGVLEEALLPMDDPTLYYNMIELVCSEGYYIQEHTFVTDDGYFLTAYRIPGGKRRPRVVKKKSHYFYLHKRYHPDFDSCFKESMNQTFRGLPVLLAHGLSAASDCWVLQGAKQDLAFILADLGYDVWFTNIRGNFYSRRHKTLRRADRAYWDFSFDEMGKYDVPNTIDYILNTTGFKKLHYIGHSMGTTMFFAMASARPEYNEKILLFVGMAPVGQIRWNSYDRSAHILITFLHHVVRSYVRNGVFHFLPRNDLTNYLTKISCTAGVAESIHNLCYDGSFFFTGVTSKVLSKEKFPAFVTHSFSGSSVKTFLHFSQSLWAPRFQHYDYGPEENYRRYAQAEPPAYDLQKITAPVALFYSRGDYISSYKDVRRLKTQLPNVVISREYTHLNHVEFVWSQNVKYTLYKEIIEVMDKYKRAT